MTQRTSPQRRSPGSGNVVGVRPRRDFDALAKRRLHAARLFDQGLSPSEVAHRLEVARQSAWVWHEAWRKEGREGLRGAGRAGRLPKMTAEDRQQVEAALVRGARAHGFDTDLWTLARVVEVIASVTGVRYHQGHVWRILRSLGWSRQRPARRAAERDEEAIAGWIKEGWPRVKKTPDDARPGSSSKTRAASR